jgi:hypothetical protein
MGDYIQILLFLICGIVLLWVAHFLFFGPMSPVYPYLPWSKKEKFRGKPRDPQVCPVCSIRMMRGDLVKTVSYATGVRGRDRLVYIKGCRSCLQKNVPRRCPICKTRMTVKDHLVSRMFDSTGQKIHIRVLGCNHCRKV